MRVASTGPLRERTLRWLALTLALMLAPGCTCMPRPPGPTATADDLMLAANAEADAGATPESGHPAAAIRASPGPDQVSLPASVELPAVDELVRTAIDEGRMPGAVVVVGRSAGVVFERAYGRRALLPAPLPMTLDTIFDLASLTKPLVTAALVQHLAERGQLDLDDRVAAHLPEFANHGKQSITIRQLLLHVSGLPIVNPLSDYADGHASALRNVLALAPQGEPGQRYVYSDVGYVTLGALIERVSGEPLEALAERVLFRPLGLADTMFRPPRRLVERIAPTEIDDQRPVPLIHGEVHDPRAYRMGGVAGNAGLFSTGSDLAKIARMLLSEGRWRGEPILSRRSVQELTRPRFVPGALRTVGFDMTSPYSRSRGQRLSPRAYGHGGYTGTSLWLDPELDLFVIVLTNRVHPHADHSVVGLQGRIADAAVEALATPENRCSSSPAQVHNGIDVLRERGFEGLRSKRVALLTHRAAVARDGTPTLDLLSGSEKVDLRVVLSPEHGLEAKREGPIANSTDRRTDLPVYSLYGKTLRPSARMLAGIDLIVVDLVDVGTRYYTYMSTLHQTLIAAADAHVPVMVLDRPNPIGGRLVQGPLLDVGVQSFVNHHRLPVRHGMTVGELSTLIVAEDHVGARLEIVPARGWTRGMLHAQTNLPWTNPSPNLRSPEAALLYPAIGLLESTNVSVGRGTDSPFSVLGAPFIDADALVEALALAELPGLSVSPAHFVPEAAPHQGRQCHGARFEVTDPETFRPVQTALVIARHLWRQHADDWHFHKLMRIWGNRSVIDAIQSSTPLAGVARLWRADLESFVERRQPFLLYPDCVIEGESAAR